MNIVEWVNQNQGFVTSASNVVLISVTMAYVVLTNKILRTTDKQFKIASNPLIAVRIKKIHIGPVFGPKRRTLTASLDIENIGNGPAIDIQIDGEIILSHTSIEGEKNIPADGEPRRRPFLRPGEKDSNDFETEVHFGNDAILHVFNDFREYSRLNEHRIKTKSGEEPFKGPKIKVMLYYNNNLGQLFQSTYEPYFGLGIDISTTYDDITVKRKEIPKDDEEIELDHHPYIRPLFSSKLITPKHLEVEMITRDKKRHLSGW